MVGAQSKIVYLSASTIKYWVTFLSNLLYYLSEYTRLIDYKCKCIHQNKPGNINDNLVDILKHLDIHPDTWIMRIIPNTYPHPMRAYVKILSRRIFEKMDQFKTHGITTVGTISQIREIFKSVKKKFSVGFQLPIRE